MTYRVSWWESVTNYHEIEIDANNEEMAIDIAMNPYAEGSRSWTDKENSTFHQEIREVVDRGLIKVEKING